jgi:ribosomal-protein-alanine N-acetyltransferase
MCTLRPYREDDAERLVQIANDAGVSRYLSRRFPFPYTADDARSWVATASRQDPTDDYVIVVDGVLAGGVGIRPHDLERSGVAEFGYWLGRAYWGRGIATRAARMLIAHAFAARDLRRLEAMVFAPNVASARVLEKCGFAREGTMRGAVLDRAGNVTDALAYALLRDPQSSSGGR